MKVPDYAYLLPEEIRHFTTKTFLDLLDYEDLAHEFVSALIEDRDPFPNAVQSANYTCVGILAHESALKGGERIPLPAFTFKA